MPGMEQNDWQQMMAAALMGSQPGGPYGQSGQSSSTMPGGSTMSTPASGMPGSSLASANTWAAPVSPYGQSYMANNMGGGMLGTSPYQSINPNAPAGSDPSGAANPMQGANPFQLQQAMAGYPGISARFWDGGGGGAEG